MSNSGLTLLRDFLVQRYDDLKRRLTRQLGSAELAGEALQDTWLRLAAGKAPEQVSYPLTYLMRMAGNVARDRVRAEGRFLRGEEIEQLFDSLSDPMPDPERTVEGRAEIEKLAEVIAEMPPRRRRILILLRVDRMQRQEVADRLGVSLGLVDRELRRAHAYCVERMSDGDERSAEAEIHESL